MLQLLISQQGQAAAPLPAWSVDPSIPGPDLPLAGASLFDRVTSETGRRQTIPFPFEQLIASVEAAAGCSGRQPCTRTVLFPLGRSLQRVAASPDFFAHPRVVSAVVGDGRGPLLLRDRLYLGYQDKADIIEVISYNETLGRFEFQIVRNYRAGQTPTVVYARRAVCVSCHQNHGPIFSRQLWLETNANPQIAARLEKQRSEFHGIAARGTADIANAIDDSTDRANRLALLQQLWREGCGDGDAGDQCRRGVFIASLQFGLTGGRTYDSAAQSFQHDVIDRLQGNAQLKWPSGIAVPDADIINRDPLMLPEDSAPSALAHVPAQFEPLLPRAPLEILTPDGRLLADQLVKGIAGFASAAARDELDRTLRQRARGDDSFDVEVPCEIIETADRVAFDCGPERMRLTGSMQGSEGTLDALSMPGSDPIRHLQITSIDRRFDATRKSVSFKAHDHGRAARLPDGNAIGTITLRWPPAAVDRPKSGSATIRIHADFAAVSAAIRTVAGPIRSSAIDEVAASLRGSRAARWRDEMRPITTVAKRPQDGKNIATPALVFEPECGNCHHSDEITPPNFLAGDAKRVTAALDACAPRIFVRLAMQDLPPAERDKTPMPPEPALLPGQVRTVPSARTSASLSAVRRAVEERLRIQYGRVPTAGELLQHGYENLRPCLPPSG